MADLRWLRWGVPVLLLAAGAELAGCACSAGSGGSGGSACGSSSSGGGAPVVVLNRDAIAALESAGGVEVGQLDLAALAPIESTTGAITTRVWHEFQFAPSMTMVRSAPAVAQGFETAGNSVDAPPFERDQVICQRDRFNQLVQPRSDGTFQMPRLLDNCFGVTLDAARVRFDLRRLRLTPTGSVPGAPANTLNVRLAVENVLLQVVEPQSDGSLKVHDVTVGSIAVDCAATVGAPLPGACGGIPVTCAPTRVDISDLHVPFVGPFRGTVEDLVRRVVRDVVTAGVVLEFESYAPASMTVSPTGAVRMTGTESWQCRNVAPPQTPPALPKLGPVRGLVRTSTTIGKGEIVGTQGSVIPFDLLPEVKVDWASPTGTPSFMGWTVEQPPEPGQRYRVHADELARPLQTLPTGLAVNLELVRRTQSNCWLKPAGLDLMLAPVFPPGATRGRGGSLSCPNNDCECIHCVPGAKFFLELTAPDGTSVLTRDLRVLPNGNRVVIEDIQRADLVRDVAPRLARLDGALCPGPNCPDKCGPGRCAPWVRMDLVEDAFPPSIPPGGGGGGEPPWEVVLWAGRSLEVLEHQFGGLTPQCPLTPIGPGRGETPISCESSGCPEGTTCNFTLQPARCERIFQAPGVTFGPMMVDSAKFQSARRSNAYLDRPTLSYSTGLEPPAAFNDKAVESTLLDGLGGIGVHVDLTQLCPAHVLGGQHSATGPCWTGTFALPLPATVQLSRGISGTTVPRLTLETVTDSTSTFGPPLAFVFAAGNRQGAFHGTLDRSGVKMFTKVPRIYNDLGVTTESWDFRGVAEGDMARIVKDAQAAEAEARNLERLHRWREAEVKHQEAQRLYRSLKTGAAFLDWEHGDSPGLPNPYGTGPEHTVLPLTHRDWRDRSFQYFADWPNDELALHWVGAGGTSACVRPDQVFATPLEFEFSGDGLFQERTVPAEVVLDRGVTDAQGLYRVTPTSSVFGSLRSAVP